jgi:tRNA G18 (ribose-2'-O)-methylase SpoU
VNVPILIGDDIENPGNAAALLAAAQMFGWECAFLRGPNGPGIDLPDVPSGARPMSREELLASSTTVLALENSAGAEDLHGFRPPSHGRFAVVVGNARRGISGDVLRGACRTIRIPVASQRINTLNVAAAAAIALSVLSRGGGDRLRARAAPARLRPEILVASPRDPIELGSVIRSATALGWGRLFLDDRHGSWFGTDRVTRSLGRGAARRARNDIRVTPAARLGEFEEACVITSRDGEPIHRVDLARGPGQIIVLPDEEGIDVDALPRLAHRVRRVHLELPRAEFPYRLRLIASIALCEVARQVGLRPRPSQGRPAQESTEHEPRRAR